MFTRNTRQRTVSRIWFYGALIAILWMLDKVADAQKDAAYYVTPVGTEILVLAHQ